MKKKIVCYLFCLLLIIPSIAFAVPQLINYQGKLTDAAGTPITGTTNITFSLYDAATGGTRLWTETQSTNLANGIFSVTLGSVTTLPADVCSGDSLYLGITVEGDAEMTPRQRITSNGYTFKAGTADAVSAGAVDTQGMADGAVTDAKISSLDASKLTGTVSDAVLPANVAMLNASQTFSGTQAGSFSGTFTGDGSGLTNLPAGTLPANVDLLDSAQTITSVKTFNPSSGTVPFTVDASKAAAVANLNADMVDGKHLTDLDSKYVNLTGGAMTGPLSINTSTSGLTVNTTNSTAGYYTCILGTGVYGQGGNVGISGSGSTGVHGTGSQYGVQGNVSGSAKAVYGVTTGTAEAGYFQINNASNSASALYATTNGTGNAGNFQGKVNVSGNLTVGGSVQASTSLVAPLVAPSTGDSGQSMTVKAATGSNAPGGNLTLSSGVTSVWSNPGSGSMVTVQGGNADASSTNGAVISVEGGKTKITGSPVASGGNVVIQGGTAAGSYAGGNIIMLPGSGSPNGNVGIGTSNPSATLDVTGTVKATSFSGDGAGLTNISPASASVTSSSILDGTIGTADIADGSITGMDIASGAITNSHIYASAAIADTKLATISTAGKVSDSALSSNVALLNGTQTFTGAKTFSNNLTMNAPVTVNSTLSATANSGNVITGSIASGPGIAVYGTTSGTGYGVEGATTGSGSGGYFQTSGSGNGAVGLATGAGTGIYGITTGTGRAGYFQISNAGNVSSALYATTNGTGHALKAESTNATPKAASFVGQVDVTGNLNVSGGTVTIYAPVALGSYTLTANQVYSTLHTVIGGNLVVTNPHTPSSASDTGTTGQIAWDADYVYICVAPNTWKRTALTSW